MPAEPTIDYEILAQDAMRGVVRTVLSDVAKSGLPGEHHFYISFDTGASGVVLSKRLKDKYPNEMTVVLQHRYWDLAVQDDRFEVKLTFDGIPERLVVPFASIKVFFDPSVRYGLQFEDPDLEPDTGEHAAHRFGERSANRSNGARATLRSTAPKKPRVPRKAKTAKEKTGPSASAASDTAQIPRSKPTPAPKPVDAEDQPRQDNGGAEIVRLDAFRKK